MTRRPTEDEIRTLVFAFYDRVRRDPDLGPIFESRLSGRWPQHLEKMCDFWSTVLLGTRRFRGDPVGTHAGIPELGPAHFDRWMTIFTGTASDVLLAPLADDLVTRVGRMRSGLEEAVRRASISMDRGGPQERCLDG